MKIDLTKKPDGATHINPHSGLWVKCFGGNSGSYQFFKDGEWEMGFGCMSNSYLEIARPEPWTGEGLPPVGAVCEYRCGYVEQPYSYAECTVIAHFVGESGKSLAAFAYVAHDGVVQLGRGMAELFRPIRTPEQIAVEEREKAIEVMIADTNILTGIMSDRRIMAGQLYDAGYRKQVSE
ncbi:hypothetical protein YA0850_18905 [Pseudomonas veronii]|uniref:Uncharacterized protein n=1 Tax=Pseudomonas veronii TaxID=76761 RepID=A0ABS0VPK1_PSEVE|nr:hypothetical protein [Pseudomonas veronii]MBI6554470.1 hypothetical protein [Pseudomonas veronii]MBI6653007.1 hypothetical protein [Pseudomonas veronii]